jgi:hypothetical protein
MKKVALSILTFALVACFTWADAQINTPAPSPLCKMTQTAGLTDITLEYSRPSVKGRQIFGKLVPYGEMWRTGANKNTMITFSQDVMIAGNEVKKGTYAIFTTPNKDSWEFVFYTDTENWGVPEKWEDDKVAARFKVTPSTLPHSVETMSIDVNDIENESCMVTLKWDKTAAGFKVDLGTNDQVNADIKRVFAGPTANDYYQAGRYYLDAGLDINKAYEWLSKANEMEPKFWRLRHESRALAQMGQYKKAIEVAERSKKMAEEAGNMQYVKFNNESIAEWKSKM